MREPGPPDPFPAPSASLERTGNQGPFHNAGRGKRARRTKPTAVQPLLFSGNAGDRFRGAATCGGRARVRCRWPPLISDLAVAAVAPRQRVTNVNLGVERPHQQLSDLSDTDTASDHWHSKMVKQWTAAAGPRPRASAAPPRRGAGRRRPERLDGRSGRGKNWFVLSETCTSRAVQPLGRTDRKTAYSPPQTPPPSPGPGPRRTYWICRDTPRQSRYCA